MKNLTLRQEILSLNPESLTYSTFLVNLAVSFGVTSIPLALFILICICLFSVFLLVLIVCIVRVQLKRKFLGKKRPYILDGIYVDEIPGEKADDLASLEFTLEYSLVNSELKICLNQVNKLTSFTNTSAINAFVVVTVYRMVAGKKQTLGRTLETKPLCRGSHHCWQETLANVINPRELPNVSILFEVNDKDSLGYCYQCIGWLEVFLKDIEFQDYAGQIYEHFGRLQPGEVIKKMDGQLCLGLCYDNAKTEIDVIIYEAKNINIPAKTIDTTESHCYVSFVIELFHKIKRVKRQELKCKQISNNPYMNAKTTFKVNPKYLREYTLICIVRFCRRFGKKQRLSTTKIGLETTPSGMCHWDKMLNGPYSIHGMWQPLVPVAHHMRMGRNLKARTP